MQAFLCCSWPLLQPGPPLPVWRIGAGANMAFSRNVFSRIGLFDERLGAGASGCSEDSEFWYRMLAAGMAIAYQPRAVVWHSHRVDRDAFGSQMKQYMRGHVAALLVQFEKHRHFWKYPEALYNDSICLLPAAEAAPLSGIIAPIADVSALASALERLLDDIGLAQDLGFRAKKRAQDFSLVSVGTQLRSFLVAHANSQTNLLHGQRPPSRPLLNG